MVKPLLSITTLLAIAGIASALDLPIPTSGYEGDWQTTFGVNIKQGGGEHNDVMRAVMIRSSEPTNVLYPGDSASFTFQVSNLSDQKISAKGVIRIVRYELITVAGQDMFHVAPRKLGDVGKTPVTITLDPKGWQNLEVKLAIPETFGGYGLVLDVHGQPSLLLGGVVRALKPDAPRDPRFRRLAIDLEDPAVMVRLGAAPNRVGMSPISANGDDAGYEAEYQRVSAILRNLHAAKLPVTMEFGHGVPPEGKIHPFGRTRSHLAQKTKAGELRPYGSLDPKESDGKAYGTNAYSDYAWLPEFDPVAKKNIKRLLKEFAWPKGPIIAVDLWNEPWNGASISGWMADDLRYREIFTAMAEAVEEVRKEDKAEVWLLSGDSSSNTFDKFFPDGKDTFLKWMDISSIHYQNTEPVTTVKAWVDRKNADGTPNPTRVWDTESWVANSDGRIASVMPTNYAMGIERAVGIWSNWGRSVLCMTNEPTIRTANGEQKIRQTNAWSVTSAVCAMQHFIGNRPFERILWQGLPFAYRFNGYSDAPEGGCIVVVGDTEAVFGAGRVPFGTVKSLDELKVKHNLYRKLAQLLPGSAERVAAEKEWNTRSPYSGVTLSLADAGGRFRLFDYNGNRIPAVGGRLVVPIDDRGFYLATDGSVGSFDALSNAVTKARLDGLMPVQIVAHDPTAPIGKGGALRLTVRNLLERPVSGALTVQVGALKVQAPGKLSLAPREVQEVTVQLGGTADPANAYALSVTVDAGADGIALSSEIVRCNVIAKRSITIDGKLDEWQGVLPQTITSDGSVDRTDAEAAWWPDKPFNPTAKSGLATAWLAYDDKNVYFATRIADEKQARGMIRFSNRDDDASFWPATVIPLIYGKDKDGKDVVTGEGAPLTWPAGVRRYTYATWANLPFGDGIDSVQIGFNVRDENDKPWYPFPKGTYRQFTGYWDTDYEYSLHAVRASKGGGTEIFRLGHPDLPHKHFFDHSPRAKGEGEAAGKLVITHVGNVRIVECSIPWSELPLVQARMQAGKTAKFTFRVNDDAGVGCLELPRGRSVSRMNAKALKPDWTVHWANEVEFGFEKKENGKDSR